MRNCISHFIPFEMAKIYCDIFMAYYMPSRLFLHSILNVKTRILQMACTQSLALSHCANCHLNRQYIFLRLSTRQYRIQRFMLCLLFFVCCCCCCSVSHTVHFGILSMPFCQYETLRELVAPVLSWDTECDYSVFFFAVPLTWTILILTINVYLIFFAYFITMSHSSALLLLSRVSVVVYRHIFIPVYSLVYKQASNKIKYSSTISQYCLRFYGKCAINSAEQSSVQTPTQEKPAQQLSFKQQITKTKNSVCSSLWATHNKHTKKRHTLFLRL